MAEDLKALCLEWQKILRLEDFDIHVMFANKWELVDCNALTQRSDDGTYAVIKILPEELLNGDSFDNHDRETDLVHELLHVREIWDSEPAWRELKAKNRTLFKLHELGIQRIAEALVSLKRKAMV